MPDLDAIREASPAITRHPATMTGEELSDAIVTLAHLLGYAVAHFRPARTEKGWRTAVAYDAAGWPDLTLVGPRVLFAEVKRDDEALSDAQRMWLRRLDLAGAEVHVWRPCDWRDGTIEKILRGGK